MSKNSRTAAETGELFKQTVPKMPDGYYSGDKPNPNLRAFVEQHQKDKPYDPATDDYDVPAFDKPIETTKATAIYNMHTYWSKKPHDAIRQYIQHYTQRGDLVLDPFCGSGGTTLAALAEGCKAIAIDRSPAATFITKNYCTPVKVEALSAAFKEVEAKLKPEIDWLYETRCHLTGKPAHIGYVVYSQVYSCPRCLVKVPYLDCVEVESKTQKGKPKTISACPHCHAKGIVEEISPREERHGAIPVLVNYLVQINGRQRRVERRHNDPDPKAKDHFEKFDLAKLEEIEKKPIPYWYPTDRMMNAPEGQECWGILWRNYLKGISRVDQFFTKQTLWALAGWFHFARQNENPDLRDLLMLTATANLPGLSIMNQYIPGATFPTKVLKGTYYVPSVRQIENVWMRMESKVGGLMRSLASLNSVIQSSHILISTQSATDLSTIPTGSVDYIFTDPPYSWKVQYGEANFLWESWLRLDTRWLSEEIIVNDVRGVSVERWTAMLTQSLTECFRVLKPGRWLSLCYHDSSEGTWGIVQDLMAEIGFESDTRDTALYIDAREKSQKQIVADEVTKRDLVINFRKPRAGERRSKVVITGEEDQQTFRQKAQAVIREFLQVNPASTKDRIYDVLVSRLVRKGQMEAHNFEELLRQVADEIKEPVKKTLFESEEPDLLGSRQVSRWYLKETEAGAEQAERATADSAGTRIYDFLAKTTAVKLKESESKISELEAEVAQRRTKLQAVDQGKSDEPRGKLVREIRELTEKLDNLNAARAEWERQALDYSQIFEFYVAAVNPKPKATLEEILEDYCYQTDEGNWRPPLTETEKKEKGSERQRAVRRRIQRFCNLLEAGDAIPEGQRPDAQTLAEWIRHCRRTGLHAHGRLLYERGGDLSALGEQAQVDVEEDYQVCVKHLERGA